MRLDVIAVGRLRGAPEEQLCGEYIGRVNAIGRQAHLAPAALREVEAKGGVTREHASDALRAAVPDGAATVLLDERGESLSSRAFAERLAVWRDQGKQGVAFLIGGADGVDDDLRRSCDVVLAFGPQTWPHKLARVMLCEQVYRAVSLLTGSPYHRD